MDPEVGTAERERGCRGVQRPAGATALNARAAANDVVECALGNDSRETVGVSGGSPSSSGRRRRTASLTA